MFSDRIDAIDLPLPADAPQGKGGGLKRYLPSTLFGRFLMIIVTPVILLVVTGAWVFYDRHWETMTARLAAAVAGDIAMVIEQLSRDESPDYWARTFGMAARTMDLMITFEPDAALPFSDQKLEGILPKMLANAMDERVRLPYLIDTKAANEWVEIRVQMDDGVLSVMSPERRLFSSSTYLFLFWMFGSAAVLFFVAILFMRNQIRPIKRLAIAADRFGKGQDVPQFKQEGAEEVRQAAAAFLVMRDRISRQISQRTDMLAGVSHDLRTPLTRMKLQMAMLPETEEMIALQKDVKDMEELVEGYLSFARGEGAEASQDANLTPILQDISERAKRDGAKIDLHIDADYTLTLRVNALKRCITNLVANARRYADHIWIRASQSGPSIEITIDDDGPGIPPAERETVFRPFQRVDPSRNPKTGGVGLGLTIARDVARSHGGDIVLDESPYGGLRAVVRLPL